MSTPDVGLASLIEYASAGRARLDGLIERYQDRPLLDIGLRIYQRDRESAGTVVGSALAFRLYLFLLPMLLFVVGALGFVARWLSPREVADAAGVTGSMAAQIETALNQPNVSRWIATVAGFVGMVWAGRSLSKVLVSAGCLAWRLPVNNRASMRVIAGVVAFVVGMVAVWTLVDRVRRAYGTGAASLSFVAAVAVYALGWMALSMLLPRATRDPGALLPGSILVGLLLAAIQAFTQLYVADRVGRASVLYGALGVTAVALGSLFFMGRIMVFGMSLSAVIYERFGSISQFVFGLPLVRILPAKSAWIRRFFDLEGAQGE